MKIKKQFLKEVSFSKEVKPGSKGKAVVKVQEWMNLWRYIDSDWTRIISIDGDFGQQSHHAVLEFQELKSLNQDGVVGPITFGALCQPMQNAFSSLEESSLRELIVHYAHQHLKNIPRELNNRNEGPWVRAYMDGNAGEKWLWCMGFVQTILDQSFSTLDQRFTKIMTHTYSCDVVGEQGKNNQKLIRNKRLRVDADQIEPGDVFLVVKNPRDWVHTGLVIERNGDWIETIEGNTNDEGVAEGFEVCKRSRNFMKHNIDLYKIN